MALADSERAEERAVLRSLSSHENSDNLHSLDSSWIRFARPVPTLVTAPNDSLHQNRYSDLPRLHDFGTNSVVFLAWKPSLAHLGFEHLAGVRRVLDLYVHDHGLKRLQIASSGTLIKRVPVHGARIAP